MDPTEKSKSIWTSPTRPWWAPDAQGFLAASIVMMTYTALMIRMFHSSVQEDKMLDTMITILFSTCLVTVFNYSFGSSRGSAAKDESQTKMVEKLVNNTGDNGTPAPVITRAAEIAAVPAARAAAPAAAKEAAPPAAGAAAPAAADIAAPPAAEKAVDAALDERGIKATVPESLTPGDAPKAGPA